MSALHHTRGPVRLVLINSGVYDYAEVELDRPLHLVGPNNSGKTTLISALQFLYIDNFGHMTFSHDGRKSREYYFPTSQSFILFECLTATGYVVVGIHGLGRMNSFEFQRFCYDGTFERDDFIDVRNVRRWDEISATLMAKDLRNLNAGDLRDGLLSRGRDLSVDLGLVPLENSGRYDSFSFVFKNLLRLADLGAGDFKNLLIDVNRGQFGSVELDLRDKYEKQYDSIRRERDAITNLDEATADIRALLQAVDDRNARHAQLVAHWDYLQTRVDQRLDDWHRELTELTETLATDEATLAEISDRHDEHQQERRVHTEEIGKFKGRLEELKRREREFRDFNANAAERKIETYENRLFDLRQRLKDCDSTDRREVETTLRDLKSQRRAAQRQLDGLDETAVTWLREESPFTEADLDEIFRLLNPELLKLQVRGNTADAHVLAPQDQIRQLQTILDGFDAEGYRDATLRVDRSALSAASATKKYGDANQLRRTVAALSSRIEEAQQLLDDIEAREALEAEFADVKKDHDALQNRLLSWNQLQQELLKREDWQQRLSALQLETAALDKTIADLVTELRSHQQKIDLLQTRQKTITDKRQALIQRSQKFKGSAPDREWPSTDDTPPPHWLEKDLNWHFHHFRSKREEYDKVVGTIRDTLHGIDRQTDGRYTGTSDEETFKNVREQLDGLIERRESFVKLWEALITNLSGELKQLDNSLKLLKQEVSRLTRRLNERPISNLQSLDLVVQPRERLVRKIRDIIAWEDRPLFGSAQKSQDATRFLSELLEDYGRIELSELFDLQFVVHKASGKKEVFTGLQRIESQGTTTTVKVLVHLQLLAMMLVEDKAFIPFFLDEISTLDEQNLATLIEHATALNFIPVVASPTPSDAVSRLYLLQSVEGGRAYLDPDIARHEIEPVYF